MPYWKTPWRLLCKRGYEGTSGSVRVVGSRGAAVDVAGIDLLTCEREVFV